MADRAPAFQWYPRDILSSMRVQEMTLAEEGAYRRLIDYCWINGYVPSDPKRAARIIGKGATAEMAQVALAMFTPDPDDPEKMYHDRLLIEEKKQESHRRQRVDAANARWGKRGTPKTGIGNHGSSEGDAEAMRPHAFRICENDASAMRKRCSSSSSSNNIYINNNAREGFSENDVLEAAKDPSVALSPEDAKSFYDYYNAQGWEFGNGKGIANLHSALRRWKRGKRDGPARDSPAASPTPQGRPNRNAGTYNDPNRKKNDDDPF